MNYYVIIYRGSSGTGAAEQPLSLSFYTKENAFAFANAWYERHPATDVFVWSNGTDTLDEISA